jgi:hypothetical protein
MVEKAAAMYDSGRGGGGGGCGGNVGFGGDACLCLCVLGMPCGPEANMAKMLAGTVTAH